MYTTCPKCKYERQVDEKSNQDICPACGIVFSKWMKQQFSTQTSKSVAKHKRVIQYIKTHEPV
jgi:ssDNA-binding Zn-finger/Zn-ribbon topoisomerase 1